MKSKDRAKVLAFIQYASDTEGMKYRIQQLTGRKDLAWEAKPTKSYDPGVCYAVEEAFRQEWNFQTGALGKAVAKMLYCSDYGKAGEHEGHQDCPSPQDHD